MTHILQRGDLEDEWIAVNPILMEREIGWETDTGRAKMGDGTSPWNSLPYLVSAEVTSVNGRVGDVVLNKNDVGLSQVDNTADLGKPVSVPQANAIAAAKAEAIDEAVDTAVAETLAQVDPMILSMINAMIPAGTILEFGGSKADVPSGWLPCDWALLNVADHPVLYAAIGYRYGGSGDQFRAPPASRFYYATPDDDAGVTGGSASSSIPNHTHNASSLTTNTTGAHVHTSASMNKQSNTAVGGNAIRIVSGSTDSGGAHSHNVTGSTGSAGSATVDTMPPYVKVIKMIRTGE